MKVKIKKKDKTEKFKLISSWEEVTLEKWLKLIEFHKKGKSEEALETIALLSNIPKDLINQLELKDVALMMGKISELQKKQSNNLKRIVKIDGTEYGFHPDLDSITLGEDADIETFIKNDIQQHLPELCAVLYRPVKEKKNRIYTIEPYDGDISIRAEEMKKMSAEQVQNALVFFYDFVKELLWILPSFLTEKMKNMAKE